MRQPVCKIRLGPGAFGLRIDPDGGWLCRRFGRLVNEAVWVGAEGVVEGDLAGGVDLVGLTVVDLVGRHQADAEMAVVLIVPVEEGSAEGLGVLDGAEPLWELGLVFRVLKQLSEKGLSSEV